VERNELKLYEQTIAHNNLRLRRNGYTPQTANANGEDREVFHFLPSIQRYHAADLLNPVGLRFKMTCNNGGSMRFLAETVETVQVVGQAV
jgi:hypothetical protein